MKTWEEDLLGQIPVGRKNAVSLEQLCRRLGTPWKRPARSTLRARIHHLQEEGHGVLTSPRTGVWLAANDAEVLEVVEELRGQVHALERRMQKINGGRCALVSCRAELAEKIRRRGGLYCCADHRYQAAAIRTAS